MGRLPLRANEHLLGSPEDGSVQLVVYGDYQCPYTVRGMALVRNLRERMGGRLLVVFRNFPLDHLHMNAVAAAEAAEAAAEQGRYWEMHELLFAHQRAQDAKSLAEYARGLGLDQARFAEAQSSTRIKARVQADRDSGKQLGVSSTPTFFVDGVKYDGRVNGITAVVERALTGEDQSATAS